jgi:hypothetical protein
MAVLHNLYLLDVHLDIVKFVTCSREARIHSHAEPMICRFVAESRDAGYCKEKARFSKSDWRGRNSGPWNVRLKELDLDSSYHEQTPRGNSSLGAGKLAG